MHGQGIPIMFSHRGEPHEYLVAAALQARLTNPTSPVIVFHDWAAVPPALANNAVHCVHVKDYYGECETVDALWFNMSQNGSDYERWCMERWMIIRNFMRAHGLGQCFACDSDVLIFSELERVKHHFADVDFTLSHLTWGCVFIFNTRVLDVFHDLVVELYRRQTSLYWHVLDRLGILRPGARTLMPLADTVLINIFSEELAAGLGFRSKNTCTIIDGGAFCPDLHNKFVQCEMETEAVDPHDVHGPYRKIVWRNGYPFSPRLGTGELIRMHCLHFQGHAKLRFQVPCFLTFVEHLKHQAAGGTAPPPYGFGQNAA